MRYTSGMSAEIREKVQVWEFFGFAEEGYFVEVGANAPKNLSQTWFLERMGWEGVLVEPASGPVRGAAPGPPEIEGVRGGGQRAGEDG